MAVATSMPVIGDLTMKFSRHSLHDSFQLPASFYQCFGQAKDIALYFQPNGFFVSPKLGQGTFEFRGSSNDSFERQYERKSGTEIVTSRCDTKNGSLAKKTTRNTSQSIYANPASRSVNNDMTGYNLQSEPREASDEELSSDEEELASYFSTRTEHYSERLLSSDSKTTEKPFARNHNRKRSMEQEEYSRIKRCCRPRLNFEKMQLKREIAKDYPGEKSYVNFFRPISPEDF